MLRKKGVWKSSEKPDWGLLCFFWQPKSSSSLYPWCLPGLCCGNASAQSCTLFILTPTHWFASRVLASSLLHHYGPVWQPLGCGWPWLPSVDLWDGAAGVVNSLAALLSPLSLACHILQSIQLLLLPAFWSHQCIIISLGYSGLINNSTYVIAMSPLPLPQLYCVFRTSQLLVKLTVLILYQPFAFVPLHPSCGQHSLTHTVRL